MIAATMNTTVATIERGDSRAMPQMPWPEVQPLPSRVPKPTSRPATAIVIMLPGIAGISGIAGGLFNPRTDDRLWRLAFIAGLILAPLAAALLGHAVPMPQMPGSMITVAVAGLLVGFGTRLGNGCTSGHGICGIARLSPRSIVATLVFMVAAIVVVAVTRHVIGG